MFRVIVGTLSIVAAASTSMSAASNRFDDYDAAVQSAKDQGQRPLLIAFQKEGQPEFPAQAKVAELESAALLEVDVETERKGQRLLDDPAFSGLNGSPGFVRTEFIDGELRIVATWATDEYEPSDFATKILRKPNRSPLGYAPLMPAKEIEAIKAGLPKIADAALLSVLDDPHTMWYDDRSMPSAYQDTVPPFVGILATRLTGNVAPVEFFENGRFRFPFGHPGGLHRAVGVEGVNFIRLPAQGNDRLPVVWWKAGNSYHWSFPIGTVVGEILSQRAPSGEKVVFEIRVRRRQRNSWHANAFRPFPTAEALASAIMEQDSCWDQNPRLVTLVNHLRDSSTLKPRVLRDTYGAFSAQGASDELPPIDAPMVTDLLRSATFRSSEGVAWKSSGKLECFAPTATTYSVVPVRYDAGLIAVHEISCNRCHQHTGRMIGEFVPEQQLYGQVWGSDGTFSWHPFDPGQLLSSPDGMAANPFRQAFQQAHVIEAYDTAKHSAKYYNVIPELRRGSTLNISF